MHLGARAPSFDIEGMNNANKAASGVVAIILLTACAGCRAILGPMSGTITVDLELPRSHPVHTLASRGQPLHYTVRWYGADGEAREEQGLSGGKARVEIDAGVFTPVLAYPEAEEWGAPPRSIPPAGALFPIDAKEGGNRCFLALDWRGGVVARLADAIARVARDGPSAGLVLASRVNWARLSATLADRPDPSDIDEARVVRAAFAGRLSTRDLTTLDKNEVSIDAARIADAVGIPLLRAYPGLDALVPSPGGLMRLAVPTGTSFLFGPRGYLAIVSAEGRAPEVYFLPYRLPGD
jgi:hypothetical protein